MTSPEHNVMTTRLPNQRDLLSSLSARNERSPENDSPRPAMRRLYSKCFTTLTGLTFAALAVVCVVHASRLGGWGWLLLWPAISCGMIAAAYLFLGVRVYGKRANGTFHPAVFVLLMPASLWFELMWWVSYLLGRSTPFDEVGPGLYLGRRPTSLPPGVANVFDLAGEFAARKAVRSAPGYRSFPILDFSTTSDPIFVTIVKAIIETPGNTLVHCAQGRGRSAQVVAGVLIARGIAASPQEAVTMIQSRRPFVRLNLIQHQQLERCLPALQAFASDLTSPAQSHTKSP